jgi:choline kinase
MLAMPSASGSPAVTQTVILAAGFGSRLGSAESGVPKPLVQVAGVQLIAHALDHARHCGCDRAIVVIGHEWQRVRAAVEGLSSQLDVSFVVNPDVEAPNGVSLLRAAELVDSQFFLQMVDHLFCGAALSRLTAQPFGSGEAGRVLIDRRPGAEIDPSDATKVRIARDGRVTAIGKGIEPWDAIDAGCFVLTRAVFDALHQVGADEPLTVSAGMRQLVAARALGTADTGGIEWVDVDTPADHDVAERLLADAVRR